MKIVIESWGELHADQAFSLCNKVAKILGDKAEVKFEGAVPHIALSLDIPMQKLQEANDYLDSVENLTFGIFLNQDE